jgi:hypothetical protein
VEDEVGAPDVKTLGCEAVVMELLVSAAPFAVSAVTEDDAESVGGIGRLVRSIVGSSGWDTAPVLARLCCFGCSLSEGERERERFLLESDIAGGFFSVRFD